MRVFLGTGASAAPPASSLTSRVRSATGELLGKVGHIVLPDDLRGNMRYPDQGQDQVRSGCTQASVSLFQDCSDLSRVTHSKLWVCGGLVRVQNLTCGHRNGLSLQE